MKKSLSIALLCLSIGQTRFIQSKSTYVAAGLLSASAFTALMQDELQFSTTVKHVANKINLSTSDLTGSIVMSSGLLGASFCSDDPTIKNLLRIFAVVPPIIAALIPNKSGILARIARIPIIGHYFKLCKALGNTPLLGETLLCTNKSCKGICADCKARRLYQLLPIAALPFTIHIISIGKNYIDYIKTNGHREKYGTLYTTLGCDVHATREEISMAYKNLEAKYHPDKFNQNQEELKKEGIFTAEQAMNRFREVRQLKDQVEKLKNDPFVKAQKSAQAEKAAEPKRAEFKPEEPANNQHEMPKPNYADVD